MKSKFAYEDHEMASKNLQKIRDYLNFLSVEISNSYGKSATVTSCAKEAAKNVDRLRFALAAELQKEKPSQLNMVAIDFYQQQIKYPESRSSDIDI